MMNCSNCGGKIPEDGKFCPACGERAGAPDLTKLVSEARAGDKQAVSELYERTFSQVYYTVKSMIKDEDAVFDIMQDAYIKAFLHLDSFEGGEKFLPWLKQIAANTARDWLKRKRPLLFTELDTGDGKMPPEERFTEERSAKLPDVVIDSQETTRLIREIIDSLPEDQRAVIGMFYYEELSVKQIAAALGVSESAVKSRLMYGRKKIEAKVRELERQGTKLYSVAPIPFLLLLFKNQRAAGAADFPHKAELLQSVLSSKAVSTGAASTAAAAKGGAAAAVGTKAAAGLGAAKMALIVLASVAVVGGVFGISRLARAPQEMPAAVSQAPEESDASTPEPEDTLPESEVPDSAPETESTPQETQEGETTVQETQEPEQDLLSKALERYAAVVSQAANYTYAPNGDTTPSGVYRYALIQLQAEDALPTLIIEQETTDYLYFARLFQYVPETDQVQELDGYLMEGTALTGGYRGGLALMADGNGIRVTEMSSGSGSLNVSRATNVDGAITTVLEYQGFFTDTLPESLAFAEIDWHDAGDASALSGWTPGEMDTPTETAEEAGLPADGDRIVFTGTVGTYSYEEVVALQGCPDPNAPWTDSSASFRLIVLDSPQTMELEGIDGPRSDEVVVISVPGAENLADYEGAHLTFSIDPKNTYWPSDTSMPVGQPATNDVHVLG